MAARQVQPQFVIGAKGRKTSVILPIAAYVDLLKTIHDLAVAAEKRPEPTLNVGEVKRRLRRHGRVWTQVHQ